MKQRNYLLVFIIPLLAFCGAYNTATAKLPPSVDGNPLPSLANMLEKITPSVVNISAEGKQIIYDPATSDPIFRHFFGQEPREKRTRGTGSGIIIDAKRGHIITNSHVIAGANNITVTLNDNRRFTAKLIGQDPKADVAVLQIKPERLTAMPIGNSDKLRVGDFVVAIGNPYGLGQSVSSGIISALGRNNLGIEDFENFIQTDAPINPGNSGGALVNLRGELIGINTAILGGNSGGNVGIGFAIPANMVVNIMDQLINYGQVERGQLGIHIRDLTPDIARAPGSHIHQGAVIAKILKGSTAEASGIQKGDIITHINGTQIKNGADVRIRIGALRIGARVNLGIIRDGKRKQITTVVGRAGLPERTQPKRRAPPAPVWNNPSDW
jgi:serine protease Do/serine protease DegQ